MTIDRPHMVHVRMPLEYYIDDANGVKHGCYCNCAFGLFLNMRKSFGGVKKMDGSATTLCQPLSAPRQLLLGAFPPIWCQHESWQSTPWHCLALHQKESTFNFMSKRIPLAFDYCQQARTFIRFQVSTMKVLHSSNQNWHAAVHYHSFFNWVRRHHQQSQTF